MQPSALTAMNAPVVHGAQGHTIQTALIGCGGRGSGAVVYRMQRPGGHVLGRMAAHTGRIVSDDDILNSTHECAPTLDRLTEDGSAPLLAGTDDRPPAPNPGLVTEREY